MGVNKSLADAVEALHLADSDPERALGLAAGAAAMAKAAGDTGAASTAERAWGLALHHRGDLDTALGHLRTAVRLSRQAGSAVLAAEARMTLAFVLIERGRSGQALQEIEIATRLAEGLTGARARAQRGTILMELGRLDEAIEDFRSALPVLRASGDRLWVCRAVSNRGLTYAFRQEFAAAEADLREAERLSEELSLPLAVAFGQANLAWVLGQRGDVCGALEYFDRAERAIRSHGAQVGTLLADRSELLLAARLVPEARESAEQAIVEYDRERRGLKVPSVHLLLARTAYLDGDPSTALTQARLAERGFRQQQRREWAAVARLAGLRCQHALGELVRLDRVERVVEELTSAGWSAPAIEGRLLTARLLLSGGETAATRARAHLGVAGAARTRRVPALERARAWYAEALLRSSLDNRRGAASAIRAGLRVLDGHQAALGATDLRAYAAGHRTELVELGLSGALKDKNPRRVFEWGERGRAIHLLQRPLAPPDDPVLAELLTALRALAVKISGSGGAADPERRSLVERQVRLEREIRDHVRRRRVGSMAEPTRPVGIEVLVGPLRDLALVEYIQLTDDLYAVTVVDDRSRLRYLGGVGVVTDLLDRCTFALQQLARHDDGSASSRAALSLLQHAAEQLDRLLLGPLTEVGDRSLVVVPTGPLQSMPWSVLPSCVGRPVTVAPSATIWYQAHHRTTPSGGQVVVAAGPTLPGARKEAEAVARLYGVEPLLHPDATVNALIGALDGAAILHLAAHGRLSAHNPLFSHLLLSDGPLSAYDLERLHTVPHTTVLAACDSGQSVACAGDELLGLSTTLLGHGAAQLVASVLPVPDAESVALMAAMHGLIVAGEAPATALATAQQKAGSDPRAMAAAAGFVCIGSGFVPAIRAPGARTPPGSPAGRQRLTTGAGRYQGGRQAVRTE